MAIGYVKESDYKEKNLQNIYYCRESHRNFMRNYLPMAEKSAFVFHHNFYPKPEVGLEDDEITPQIKQKLIDLQQKYGNIISNHSSDTGLTHLEEMKIDTDLNLPPVASKLTHYP